MDEAIGSFLVSLLILMRLIETKVKQKRIDLSVHTI